MVGTTISHYKVLEKIGEGGMGVVYRATDTKLNRDVALKILPEQFASDAQRMGRFQREAEVLASLDHPNIGQIYGIEDAGQTKALVLQLIEGPTLAERIAQGPIPVEEALQIALQMAEGLEAAHEKGVIHRDLKPANIKITPEGQVKILDFGLAKALEGETPPDTNLSQSPTLTAAATQAGVILGTAAYMSPEQARGEATDKKVDVWAFGCVLFEMLTGRATFEGKTVSDVLAGVLRIDPEWKNLPPNLHPRIRLLLERCLEKESKDRYQGVGDARVDIQKALADPSGVLVQPVAEVVQAQPRWMLPWVVAGMVLSAVTAGVAVWSVMDPVPPRLARFAISEPTIVSIIGTITAPTVTISPDGTRIVYVGPREQLYVRAVDQLGAVALRGGVGVNPFISHDGNWVGFKDDMANGTLKKVSIHGGPPVVLSEGFGLIAGASWGADDTIIFGTFAPNGLFRVSAAGGEEREPLTNLEEGESGHRWPEILPGGRTVLFTVEKGQGEANLEIAALNLETGERKLLIPGGSNPHYAATGHIVYGIAGTLRAVPFDLDAVEVKGDPIPVLEGVVTHASGAAQFSLAKDGTLVYVPGTGGGAAFERTLGLVDRDGEVELLNVPPKQYLSPRLSPDGQTLLVQSVEDSGNVIWLYDLTGDRQIQQRTFEGNNERPVWTPDGQRITFSSDRDGTMSLYWMPADGSGVAERLTTAEEGTTHWMGSWSPDGELVVFTVIGESDTDRDIRTLSVDDGETQSLLDTPGTRYSGPELSPNGEWLAYNAGPSGLEIDIYVEPFPPTGSRRRISQDGGYAPLWSPEGSELFYRPGVGVAGGVRTLRSVDIVTEPAFAFSNEQTLPVGGFNVVSGYRSFDVSPDGERLLVVFPADRPDTGEPARPQINIVLNWFEELKERVPVP